MTTDHRPQTSDLRRQKPEIGDAGAGRGLRATARQWRSLGSEVWGLKSEDGAFSLVELVIAMAILGVGIVGAMRVFPIGLRASRRAEVRSRAVIVAQRTLE